MMSLIDKAFFIIAVLMVIVALIVEVVYGPAPYVSFSLLGVAAGLVAAALSEPRGTGSR